MQIPPMMQDKRLMGVLRSHIFRVKHLPTKRKPRLTPLDPDVLDGADHSKLIFDRKKCSGCRRRDLTRFNRLSPTAQNMHISSVNSYTAFNYDQNTFWSTNSKHISEHFTWTLAAGRQVLMSHSFENPYQQDTIDFAATKHQRR
jgi:hypothetical protein